MAFKNTATTAATTDTPAALFKTLTQRTLPDVMPHQKEMLEEYADTMVEEADVALQLPTGSGKTLVGLLIGEWRRRSFKERVVYLCPTKQLVHQTVNQSREQYGIDLVGLTGRWRNFPAADQSAFLTGKKIAVTTYSGLFNTNPFFSSPDVILIDDAHAAENYIASMWSLHIESGKAEHAALHAALAEFFKRHIDGQSYVRLTGDWRDTSDAAWVDKLPSPLVREIDQQLCAIVDAHAEDHDDFKYPWSLLRDHLDACHIYLSSSEILIRPLIPPTWSLPPFCNAKQRVFMSATLGEGGDLERLTGRSSIRRLAAPHGFQTAGVGRRFFMFPSLSLEPDGCDAVRLAMQKKAGRSVVLTPNTASATNLAGKVENLEGFKVFRASDIEAAKDDFVAEPQAVAILANRYDGIDFPHDECRLLCLDGLPRAMNAQERFLMSKMGASALFNERIQTRILQAAGRCTRALQDRSAVVVTGRELVDYLVDDRNWAHFHPELQAELFFGVEQTQDVTADEMLENFQIFLENKEEWAAANGQILIDARNRSRASYPAMDTLAEVVAYEVCYQTALWNKDYERALTEARRVQAKLVEPELRGYRALWHYLAGAAALRLSKAADDGHARAAREQFRQAKQAAPYVAWMNDIAREVGGEDNREQEEVKAETLAQVEGIERRFLALGTSSDRDFEKLAATIMDKITDPNEFEEGQRLLGELLGFKAGNAKSDAAPDPWWIGATRGIVFEDHANAEAATVFGANKARQSASHPEWIAESVDEAKGVAMVPVLVTPCTSASSGAKPHLKKVLLWPLDDFRQWATRAIAVLRDLKATMPPEGDLAWRAIACSKIEAEGLTVAAIEAGLGDAASRLTIVE